MSDVGKGIEELTGIRQRKLAPTPPVLKPVEDAASQVPAPVRQGLVKKALTWLLARIGIKTS